MATLPRGASPPDWTTRSTWKCAVACRKASRWSWPRPAMPPPPPPHSHDRRREGHTAAARARHPPRIRRRRTDPGRARWHRPGHPRG
ncbi:hypothetical protein G6F61_015017 [Rhizopus arrhizus]|nr:hypothetical protein G6F61_015017 [Rhizopus arrhizus]